MSYKASKDETEVSPKQYMNCRFCGMLAPRDDLTEFGARCRVCYDKYCASFNPSWYPEDGLTKEQLVSVIRRAKQIAAKIGKGGIDDGRTPAMVARDNLLAIQQQRPLTQAQREFLATVERKIGAESGQ